MFQAGDKVVHPAHGAGIIAGIETHDNISDKYSRYYVIDLAGTQRKLMIPVQMADTLGLRPVVSEKQVSQIMGALRAAPEELPNDFGERQAHLSTGLKSGDAIMLAEIVRNLHWRGLGRKLSATDQELYLRAKQMLAGELALAEDVKVDKAIDRIEATLNFGDQVT
ncbi:MAG: CarD family transcriptional regulator [Anaerolineae bacterium]